MSRPAPTPKQSMLQSVMLMLTIFLAMQLFLNSSKSQPQDFELTDRTKLTLTSQANIETAMMDAARHRRDQTLTSTILQAWDHLIDDDLSHKRITPYKAEELKVKGVVFAADTLLRAGVHTQDSGRLRQAYNLMEKFERGNETEPQWHETFSVPQDPNGTVALVDGHSLYEKIVDTLSKRNKTDLIWGAIPHGYDLIDTLVKATGSSPNYSYAIAALILAFVVRAIVYPLSQKQIMAARQMSQLTPRLREIKDRYKDSPTEMNAKTMDLYREYGINPFQGCVPALIQMPLFLTVYQCMLHYQFEFTKGHFLWINEATSQATHGFIGANLGQNDYILVVIYGITMCITTLLTPVTDPTQVRQQRLMGVSMSVIFTVMMFFRMFPVVSGFVLYWIFTNLLATAQSLRAYRLPMPPLVKVNAPGGGVFPGGGSSKWSRMIEEARKMAGDQDLQQRGERRNGGGLHRGSSADEPHVRSTGVPAKHKPKKRR